MRHADSVEVKGISAVSLSPEEKWIALGFNSGAVQIWDWSKGERLKPSLVNHSYRITSLAFSPELNQLAIGSVDQSFSLVPLNRQGKRDTDAEILKINNVIRPLEVFFWNNNILVTRSWNNLGKAYATNVERLREELNRDENEKE